MICTLLLPKPFWDHMAVLWPRRGMAWIKIGLISSRASCKHSRTHTICFFLSRHCFVPSCLLLCICVFSSNLAIMGERNQKMGLKKNKSKKKSERKFLLVCFNNAEEFITLRNCEIFGFQFSYDSLCDFTSANRHRPWKHQKD